MAHGGDYRDWAECGIRYVEDGRVSSKTLKGLDPVDDIRTLFHVDLVRIGVFQKWNQALIYIGGPNASMWTAQSVARHVQQQLPNSAIEVYAREDRYFPGSPFFETWDPFDADSPIPTFEQ